MEKIRGYAVVHVRNQKRAALYGQKLTEILGKEPEFMIDVAPVIGVHAGIGAVAVALLSE
jgi:fatty acid-binding protein DegV